MYGEHACRKKITPITHNETNNVASRKFLANLIFHSENRLVFAATFMHFVSNPLPKSLGQTYYKKSASWITAMSHNKLKEHKKQTRQKCLNL
jgi:hypothetical protein